MAATATVQVPDFVLGTVQVNYQGSNYSVEPWDVVFTYSNANGTCTDRYEATVPTPPSTANWMSGTNVSAPGGNWLVNPGQPYAPAGTLSVCADTYGNWGGYSGYFRGSATLSSATSMTSANAIPAITITTAQNTACPGATTS